MSQTIKFEDGESVTTDIFCDYEIEVSTGYGFNVRGAVLSNNSNGTIAFYGRNGETLCIVPVSELRYAVKMG